MVACIRVRVAIVVGNRLAYMRQFCVLRYVVGADVTHPFFVVCRPMHALRRVVPRKVGAAVFTSRAFEARTAQRTVRLVYPSTLACRFSGLYCARFLNFRRRAPLPTCAASCLYVPISRAVYPYRANARQISRAAAPASLSSGAMCSQYAAVSSCRFWRQAACDARRAQQVEWRRRMRSDDMVAQRLFSRFSRWISFGRVG